MVGFETPAAPAVPRPPSPSCGDGCATCKKRIKKSKDRQKRLKKGSHRRIEGQGKQSHEGEEKSTGELGIKR